jgi:tRNA(Ile)-lysidine synthase
VSASAQFNPAALAGFAAEAWRAQLPPVTLAWLPERSGAPALIACSGGADSVFLTLLLHQLYPQSRAGWHLTHVNHGLRGAEAEADAAFCAALAKALGLPFHLRRIDWPAPAAANTGGVPQADEATLRCARHAQLGAVLRAIGGRAVWLGQQRDDIAETLLMRLGAGAGLTGLAAPRPVQAMADGSIRVRPLLAIGRAELRAALSAAAIPWREDRSNAASRYLRNRLRHAVMPAWREAMARDVGFGAAASRRLLEEADTALDDWLARLLPAASSGPQLDATPLLGLPRALWRRAYFRWCAGLPGGEPLGATALEELLDTWSAGGRGQWSRGAGFFRADGARLTWIAQAEPAAPVWQGAGWPLTAILFLPTGGRLHAEPVDPDRARARCAAAAVDPAGEAIIDCTASALRVDPWCPGDRYRPLGAPGSRKLQDLFTDRAIAADRRHRLPVIRARADGPILWTPGLPPADSARIGAATKHALRLTYRVGCGDSASR